MAKKSTYNILMYSHDTYGLGHIRRTMAIASQLTSRGVNILILTGSPIVGRFDFPEQIDFVRIPGMIKKSNELYVPHSIKINAEHALTIRRSIIKATAKAFKPDLFIVDKAPQGLKREIMPTLKMLAKNGAKTVLGLRDIMDDAASTRQDWEEKGVYEVLEKYYSEIWVYGHREFYDPIEEYAIPESISRKMIFTGYIPRKTQSNGCAGKREQGLGCRQPLVVATTGGGGDGYPLMDAYLKNLEARPDAPFRSVMVTGPFMPKAERKDLARRAKRLGVPFYHFYRRMEKLIGLADLVVSMGGYNTVCETLSMGKVGLIVPRETPRLEQLIRSQMFKEQNLCDYLPWQRLGPETLNAKIVSLLENPEPVLSGVQAFRFTGLEVMRQRLEAFRHEAS